MHTFSRQFEKTKSSFFREFAVCMRGSVDAKGASAFECFLDRQRNYWEWRPLKVRYKNTYAAQRSSWFCHQLTKLKSRSDRDLHDFIIDLCLNLNIVQFYRTIETYQLGCMAGRLYQATVMIRDLHYFIIDLWTNWIFNSYYSKGE